MTPQQRQRAVNALAALLGAEVDHPTAGQDGHGTDPPAPEQRPHRLGAA